MLAQYAQFAYEGAAYYAYPTPRADDLPVYRFYNTRTGTHFYTQSEAEKNFVLATYPVFAFEGPAYYAPPVAGAGRAPLFRFFNTNTGAHFFTTNVAERDMVLRAGRSSRTKASPTRSIRPARRRGNNIAADREDRPSRRRRCSSVPGHRDARGRRERPRRRRCRASSTTRAPTRSARRSWRRTTMNYAITVAGTYAFRAVAYDNLEHAGLEQHVQR